MVYADKIECDFEQDVEFVNRLYKEAAKPLLVDNSDIDRNREQYREQMDQSDEEDRPQLALDAKVPYTDDLADIHKANIAFKTMQVLGQVLQSASGSLEGDQKMQIIEACYALGLRALSAILNMAEVSVEDVRLYLASLITERAALRSYPLTEGELLKRTDEAVIALTLSCAYGTLKKISFAVGSQRLEESYTLVRQHTGDSLALDLIGLLIKLDHFGTVPEYDIVRVRDKVVRNMFGYTILRQMITDFLYLYRVDIRTVQKLGSLFSIKSTVPEMLLPDFKKD